MATIGDVVHAFGENGELSRGARAALDPYATRAYVDSQVFPVGMGNPVPTVEDLPAEGDAPGDARLVISNLHLYVWDSNDEVWLDMGTMRGPVGPPPELTVGTTTTLPPGSPATFTIVGDSPDYVVNIGLPEGDKGDTGDPGAGLVIIDVLDNVGQLPGSGDLGDAYIVGGAGGDLYIWVEGSGWTNAGPLGSSDWDDIDGKPSTFPSTIALVSGLGSALDGKVPTSRTVNGKALTSNISLTSSDVGAPPAARTPFVNSWTGSAWQYATLGAAQAAGLVSGQIAWHIGGSGAPGWARAGDVVSPGS